MGLVTKTPFLFPILFLINVTVVGQTPEELLPDEGEITGWTFDLDSNCNEGIAEDDSSLFDAIDGGAEVYIERGFVAGAYDGYTDGSNNICVEIYDQGTPQNAYLVYHFYDTSAHDSTFFPFLLIPDLGDSARLDTTYVFDYVLEMLLGKFFMRFIGPRDEQIKETIIDFAKNIENQVPIITGPYISPQTGGLGEINVYPSNGIYMFKIMLNPNYFEKSQNPKLAIYNSKGRLILTLLLHSFGSQHYISMWDGKNRKGALIAKGIYTAIINCNGIVLQKTFVVGY